jgi:D-apionolactonase
MQIFNAGAFTVGYLNGFLRRIKYGDVEVLRMIYMALRDQNWNTYEPIIQEEEVVKLANEFIVNYECFHQANDEKIFKWHVLIKGSNDGEITFEIKGQAIKDVLKNRAGLCILHPLTGTAGAPCELTHSDGSRTNSLFPTTISADNPFKDLRAFRWKCEGKMYSLLYEGDGFETEDQRNWCDASYKTFCTPLSKPFPVLLKAGDTVYQKVTFKSEEVLSKIPYTDKPIEIVTLGKMSALPSIGISASTETETISEENILALRALKLHHYRVEVNLSHAEWIDKFEADCNSAAELRLPLEIALHVNGSRELKSFREACATLQPEIKQIILLSDNSAATPQTLVNEATSVKTWCPSALIGGGTDYNFRELNVNRFDGSRLDFISYSIDPQEHATDDLTIIENIAAQAHTVQSARDLYGSAKRVHISSLTLRKRFNPAATVTSDKILPNERKTDVRQATEFAAVFTLGSIKSLAMAEANSVTFYQSIGRQGVMSVDGEKYPVYRVLQQVLSMKNAQVIHTVSSDPTAADALLLTNGANTDVILVNYTAAGQVLVFEDKKYALRPYEIKTMPQTR